MSKQINIYFKLPLLLLLFFIFSLPFKESYNSISFILLTVFSIFIAIKDRNYNDLIIKGLFPFLGYFSLVLISYLYSDDTKISLNFISRFLPFLLFPFIFSVLRISKKEFQFFLKIYIYWITLLAITSQTMMLIKLFKNNDILFNLFRKDYSYENLSNTIGLHSTYYAMFVAISIIIIVSLIFHEKRRKVFIFYFVLLIYQTFFLFHLSTRTPVLSIFIFYVISIFYYFIKKQQLKKGILILLILLIFTSVVGYNVRVVRYRFQQIFGMTYANGARHDDGVEKLKQWQAAIDANNNIIFGNSVADADTSIINSNIKHGLNKFAKREYNAHNQFIQTYVGLGLIGLFFLLFLFVFYIRFFYLKRNFLGFAMILLFLILFQTESYLQRHNGIMMFSFIIGLFVNQNINQHKNTQVK